MEAEVNPFDAPQSSLNKLQHSVSKLKPNETRWNYMQYGYQLGFLAGCLLLLYLVMRTGLQLPGFWLLMGFVYIIVTLPLCTVGGLFLGTVAAITDRMLQDLGWRKPYQLLELDD